MPIEYASILRSISGLLRVIDFCKGNRIHLRASPRRKRLANTNSSRNIIVATVVNRGTRKTKIKECTAIHYKNYWKRIFNKEKDIIELPAMYLPQVVEPSEEYTFDAAIENLQEHHIESGYLFLNITHTMSDYPLKTRLKLVTVDPDWEDA